MCYFLRAEASYFAPFIMIALENYWELPFPMNYRSEFNPTSSVVCVYNSMCISYYMYIFPFLNQHATGNLATRITSLVFVSIL